MNCKFRPFSILARLIKKTGVIDLLCNSLMMLEEWMWFIEAYFKWHYVLKGLWSSVSKRSLTTCSFFLDSLLNLLFSILKILFRWDCSSLKPPFHQSYWYYSCSRQTSGYPLQKDFPPQTRICLEDSRTKGTSFLWVLDFLFLRGGCNLGKMSYSQFYMASQ